MVNGTPLEPSMFPTLGIIQNSIGHIMDKRAEVFKYIREKNKIETEIKQLFEILTKNNVGMHEPLVDAEGFPRNDIDVYQVRTARHKIICLQNDHTNMMLKIEAGLHELHFGCGADVEAEQNSLTVEVPFARISLVSPGSPANICGLKSGDMLLEFGSVNKCNFSSMKDIALIASHSVGTPLHVKVRRPNRHSPLDLELTPLAWVGRGLLGCKIDPLPSEPVER